MDTGSGTASAAQPSVDGGVASLYRASQVLGVSVGALERWTESGRLEVVAQLPRGTRKVTYVSLEAARAVIEAPVRKRRDEDDELERAYVEDGLTLDRAGARVGLTGGGAAKRLKARGVSRRPSGSGGWRTWTLKLEGYCRQHGLLTSAEIADRVGCAIVTVDRHAAAGRLGAERYGEHRTWLFPPAAVDELRTELAAGRERRATAVAAARVEGRTARSRLGVEKPCPCGCGRLVYLHAAAVGRRPGYASYACWSRHRWKHGLGLENFIENRSGVTRRRWKLLWAPKPGAPRKWTVEMADEALRLHAKGLGYGSIARSMDAGMTVDTVRRMLGRR